MVAGSDEHGSLSIAIARGVALFFGAFSAVSALVIASGAGRAENVWWIDTRAMPRVLAIAFGALVPVVLLGFAARPAMRSRQAWLTSGVALAVAAVALSNALGFYLAWNGGTIHPGVPIPFSLVIAAAFAWLAYTIAPKGEPAEGDVRTPPITVALATTLALAVVFPLAQVLFFGTTDYRRPSDDAVVFGALVYPNGTLSQSLDDRVCTAVELYRQGDVSRLIMSGGVGTSGIDEAAAMKRRAVGMGVPADAVVIDSEGVNTDATVANTRPLFGGPPNRVLVVSQFYHLPRIKLAYRAAGVEVQTVPARSRRPIVKTPLFVVREIPGFWVYWARSAWRDIRS